MMTRPVSHNIRAEQSLWHGLIYDKQDNGGSFQVTVMYQQSVRSPETAKYFTFGRKTLLRVIGDNVQPDYCYRDVRAEWLGLPSDFRGALSVDPEQRQFGCVLAYSKDLKTFFDHDFLQRFWFEVSLPLVAVENDMRLCQCDIINRSETFPHDIVDAFNQSDWRYAKMNGKLSCFNLAPLRVRFGGAFMSEGNNEIVSYTALLFPTGRGDCNQYLFEPVADYNGHFGFGSGVNFQFVLNKECDNIPNVYDYCFFLNFEAIFLVRKWHCRTFDLKCRPVSENCPCNRTCAPCEYKRLPWSRYLLFNSKNGVPNQNIPGVNILTRRVKVRPYGIYDFSCGFRLKGEKFEAEIGYGIWGHAAERIECIEKFAKQWGIAGNDPGDTVVKSASRSSICQRGYASPEEEAGDEFIAICASDLDLDSGASQGALNHIISIAGGFDHKGKCVDAFFGLGFYFDVPQKNSALQTWGAWLKFGSSF